MIVSFLVFVFALFLVLGAYLLATHGSDKKRARLQKRLNEALLHSANVEDVDVQEILRVLRVNADRAQRMIAASVADVDGERSCGCAHALRDAIITDRARIPARARRILRALGGEGPA